MPRGGMRENAGRPCGASNLLNRELKEKIDAVKLIDFLQKLALGEVEGATITERKDASIALLRKIIPDTKQTDINLEHEMQTYSEDKWNRLTDEEKKEMREEVRKSLKEARQEKALQEGRSKPQG